MSIVESAEIELRRCGYNEGDTRVVVEIMRKFFDQWNSGGAVSIMVPVLDRLLRGLPLAPLTGEDDEWSDPMGDGELLQNIRCGTVFKRKDGSVFDVDAPDRRISFPYLPQTKNLDPIVVM